MKIFAEFDGKENISLPALCHNLLAAQKKSWPGLASAYEEISAARKRLIPCGNYSITAQFNPRRTTNSTAAVDEESIRLRPCFLCTDNLPPEQQAVFYRGEYLLLCNPAPIFDHHFTIASVKHNPQEITSSLNRLLQLAWDLSPGYAVFYNGPACGASAPDHLHFQACPAENLPFLKTLSFLPPVKELSSVRFYQGQQIDRSIILLESQNSEAAAREFLRLFTIIQKILDINREPMINLLCTAACGYLRLAVFLRAKHRPAAYFASGERRIFVSPGAVDMAGMIITTQETDFNRLTGEAVRSIYREVSLPEDITAKIINAL